MFTNWLKLGQVPQPKFQEDFSDFRVLKPPGWLFDSSDPAYLTSCESFWAAFGPTFNKVGVKAEASYATVRPATNRTCQRSSPGPCHLLPSHPAKAARAERASKDFQDHRSKRSKQPHIKSGPCVSARAQWICTSKGSWHKTKRTLNFGISTSQLLKAFEALVVEVCEVRDKILTSTPQIIRTHLQYDWSIQKGSWMEIKLLHHVGVRQWLNFNRIATYARWSTI